ncbi:LPD38 domain-containing protein [Prevotella nigrescens]|uniref:LPD38 domain-containing protein n=1 Tax=Prevotella nigrescens TaxID=28133 RepID=UPI002880909C|nr:LPD38 domain-containing protein [Prevotella nigrescens]
MPDIKNNIKVIYDALAKEGYNDLGSEQTFAESMADENNRKLVYNTLKNKGFSDVKDYDSFSNMVYQRPNTNRGTAQAVNSNGSDLGGILPKGQGVDSQPTPEYLKVFDARQIPEDFKVEGDFVNNPIVVRGKERTMGDVANELYRGYNNDYRTTENKKANAWGRVLERAKAMGLDEDQAAQIAGGVDKLYRQNLATDLAEGIYQRMYKGGDALTNVEDVLYDKDFAQLLANTASAVGYNNVGTYIEHDLKPALDKMLQKKFGGYKANLHRIATDIDDIRARVSERERKKAEEDRLRKQVEEMKLEGERLQEQGTAMQQQDRPWWAGFVPAAAGGMNAYDVAAQERRNPDADRMVRTGRAIQYMADDALTAINEDNILHTQKTTGLTNQIKNAFGRVIRGGAHAIADVRTWDFGFTELNNATVVKAAADAYAKNKATAEQKTLLNAVALKNVIMSKHGEALEGLYGAGTTTVQMIPFMAQFAFSPVKGVGPAAQKYCRGQLEKTFGKYATEAVGKFVVKGGELAGRFAGDLAQGAAMTTIFNMADVAADTKNRMTGDLEAATDDKGNIVYSGKRTNAKSGGRAFAEAFAARTIENQSELVGEYFTPLLSFMQKGTAKALDKLGLNKTKNFLTGLNNKEIVKGFNTFVQKTQWHGTLGEYGEEVVGNIENALFVGDLNMKLDTEDDNSVFSKKLNYNTFLGVALGGGIISTAHTANYLHVNRKVTTALNDADVHGDVIFGTGRWEEIKSEIENAPDEKAGELLKTKMESKELNDDQKKTIAEYTKNLYIKRGSDISQLKNALGGNVSAEQEEVMSAYENGHNATDEQLNEVKVALDDAEKNASELLGEEALDVLDEIEDVDTFKYSDAFKSYTREQKAAAVRYMIARTAYKGMIERVQDDINSAVNKSNAEIDNLTHKESESIIRATLKDADREVYIVSGNVAMSADGKNVDTEKSDKNIVVYDAQKGKKEMLDIHDFLSVDTPIDAESYKADRAEEVTQEIAQGEAARIDGVRTFHYDDVVKVQGKDGNLIDGIVQDVQGDEVVVVSDAYPGGKTYTAAELTAMQPQPQTVAENATVEQQAEEAVADNESNEAPAQTESEVNSPQAETETEAAQPTEQPSIPTDEKGNLLYHQAPVELTIKDLYDGTLDDAEIADFVSANIEAAQKEYNKVSKKAPKIGTDKGKYLQEKKAYQEEVAEVKRKVDYWQSVEAARQELTHTTKAEIEAKESELNGDAARREYQDGRDTDDSFATSEDMTRDFLRGAKITPESFREETGLGVAEQRKFVGMISNQGDTIGKLGERLAEYDELHNGGIFFHGDSNEARSAIINAIIGSKSVGDFKASTDTTAEDEYVEEVARQRDEWYYNNFHLTYEEYLQYEETLLPELLRKYANFAEEEFYRDCAVIFEEIASQENTQTIKTEDNDKQGTDTTAEEQGTDRSTTVLPGEKTGNSGRGSQSQEQGREVQTGLQGEVENATVSEAAQGEVASETDYILSNKEAENGENFYQDVNGNIDLANIPEEVFDKIDRPKAPLRLTPSMLKHVFDRHGKEMGLSRADDAIDFILDVMDNFDHVRQGDKNAVIFSIENGRSRTGRRAVTVLLNSESGEYYGIKTSGYERIEGLNKKPLLWEKGANKTSATGVAPANVTTEQAQQGNEPTGSASNHSNDSDSKVTQSSETKQEKENKFSPTPRKEGESILDFAERVAAEHQSYQERKTEEAKVDTNPTDAQKEAGNYKKGHIKVDGLNITIEQPKGSIRRGTDANGKQWESEMHNTYGYIRGTESVDGDHIDIFLSDNPTEGNVFVVDQINKDGSFDEHKVMYGFPDMESAKRAYLSNYEEGWQGLGSITEVKKEDFKKWIDSSKRKTKPFAEYSTVKTQGDMQTKKPTEAELRERKKQELKNKLKAKLRGQLNVGVDPELFMIGVELASMEIEDGARKFVDFAKKMISEIGDEIRPYLKSIYNGARDLPGMESLSEEMTPYDEVRVFNVATIGKEAEDVKPSVFDTAEQISNEQAVEHSAKEEAKSFVESEDVDNDVYSITKQHNNKKDIDIWVVRGKERTDKDVYMQRKQAAREHNGYYSSFRGVNGFVFDTPEDAQSFADKVFDAKDEQINTETNENYAHNSNEIMHEDEDSNAANLLTDSHNEQEQSGKEAELHGLKIGDKVLYKGKETTIFDFDNGRPVLDTGLAPVVYDVVDMDAVKPIEKQEQTKTNVKEDLTEEKTEAKGDSANNKTLSSHTEGNLFDAAPSLTNKDKDDEVHVRNGGSTAKREQGHEPRQNEPLGESKQNEAQRPDGQRMGGRDTTHSRTDAERSGGLSDISKSKQRLNTTNNHGERGVDYAPTSVDARIEANIQAIELANELIENGEKATPQQMAVLRKFSGWGGLGKAFNETVNGYYGEVNKTPRKLKELLGEEAYNNAIESANSSYYTPAHVIDTLWDIAEKLGFKGGNILEGSAGIGNIIGQIPTHLSENSNIHAVEKDPTAGSMLSLLYPEAKVDIQGFEETYIPNGSIDLAITNVPFVTGLRVWDTTSDKDLSKKFHDIHNFCIAKNVRKLREGGIGIFISSNGTLDSSQKLRDWVVSEGNADFIGAFRLNNKTFLGTSVTSDIIVIRKRVNGKKSANAIDVSTVTGERTADFETGETKRTGEGYIPVVKHLSMDYNKYFIEHPENMAGEMAFAFEHGETYRATTKGLYPAKDKPQDKLLKDFVNSLTAKQEQTIADNKETDNTIYETLGNDVKEGSMVVSNGELCIAQYGQAVPLGLNANKVKGHTKQECFNAYTEIKRALGNVLTYETENADDKGLQPLLDKLNKVYDDFVNTYGHFHKNTAISFLRKDVDYSNVLSLENYKEENDAKNKRVRIFSKTDVFSKRVVTKETEPKPDNIKDGVVVSIYKNGRIDIPYISKQLNLSEDAVREEIINTGLGFEDPVSKEIEASYKYLSGNVREKLQQAEDNNENGAYNNNIKALKEVIPANIPAHLIEFNLGSSWVTPKLYEDYTKEKTGIEVKFVSVGGTWFMKAPEYGLGIEQNRSMGVRSTIVQKTILGHELIEAAIQNKTITVSKTQKNWDGKTETIIDKEATQACNTRIDEIRQEFKDWARGKMQSDVELNTEIERIYNDTFNNYVPVDIPTDFIPKHFGGSTHNITLRPHQAKAVVRGTMQPLMLAHEVGTGKTFTLISTAMEMRRLGTARKPMIVVQNATVGQFVASAKALYPNAKILTLENADHGAEGRKRFYAKIRYNDWDMIVVPQSTFEFIPDSEERQIAFIKDKVEEKMIVLEKMREADESGQSFMTRRAEKELEQLQEELAALTDNAAQKRNEKQLTAKELKKKEVSKQNAEVKAREMLDRKTDDVENFDDMGIDALLVDEAHEYKHLGFATAMQRGVKGVDPSYSKKSQGVFLKTQAVLSKNHGRNVIFATGTPISNTAAEIWTFMRYLMPSDTMKEYGIYYFDDFVRNFGSIQQMLEFTTSGKFKENNRFAGYIDLPELARIWSSVSDIVLTEDQEELKEKIPEIEGGKAQDIYLPQTKALRSVMKYVKKQLTDYDNMSGKEKKENSHIPLTMYGIAKAAAVDARLVDATAEDDVNNKTNEAVRQTLSALKETASYKGTVAIFADIYQNKASGFNLYEDIRKKLIEQGVPEKEIFIMKSGMTINKKLEIFDKVNSGEIRVIMGSTFTLGTGVNIQERLHTLIHVDAPNRPMDYTQRNGRILRQGNIHKDMNKPVRILRFGVEDSLDVTAYQRLKTKGAIADSIMNSKQLMANSMENRAIEEEEDVFGDTVAQLSGSEYAMLKNQAEKAVRKFESKKRQWEADQTYIHNAKPRLRGQIFDAERMLEDNRAHLETVTKTFPNGEFKKITIGKMQFDSIDAMSDFIKDFNKKIREESDKIKDSANSNYNSKLVVNIDGLDFVVHTEMTKETASKGINIFSKTTRKMYYSQDELGLENVPIKQGLLRNGIEDIVLNVITGHDFAERIDTLKQNIARYKSDLELILARDGKPFEFEKELENAKEKYEEYTEAMKKELEEKEKKYAELDSKVEEAGNLSEAEEAEEDESSKNTNNDVLYRTVFGGNSGYVGYSLSKRADVEELIQHATQTARSLNLDNVEIVADGSIFEGKKATAKGFYNKKTGKITIIAGNHTGIADIEKTVLHEGVAHYGLRKLFGDNFNAFLDTVIVQSEEYVRRKIAEMAAKHEWSFRTATEEYLAGMAEDANFEQLKPTTWQRIKRLFGEMMSALGLHHSDVTDNDLRYLLWRSYKNLENGGKHSILDMAEDIALQYRLKVGNYTDKFTDELKAVNERFNKELNNLTEENADKVALGLGKPSKVLLAAGVEDKPMKLYGNKVIRKMKKHGFSLEELRDLPRAVADPVAVFNNYQREGNRSILTELMTQQGNFLVSVNIGKDADIDFNIVRSVFGKGDENVVAWINNGLATYINKEKALSFLSHQSAPIAATAANAGQESSSYLHFSERNISEASNKKELSSAAKIIKDFHNPKLNSNILYRSSIDPTENEMLPDAHTRYEKETKEPDKINSVPKTHNFSRRFYKSYVDSMLALKSYMNSVLEATGDKLSSHEDVYKAENAMTSKNKTHQEAYERDYYNPMIEAGRKLCEAVGMDYDALKMYIVAKHGLERNKYMGERAARNDKHVLEAQAAVERAKKAFADNPTNDNEEAIQAAQDAYELLYEDALVEYSKRDYSGLTDLTGEEDVAVAERKAQELVDKVEQKPNAMPKVNAFWKKVNAATKATLRTGYESGIMTKEAYEHIAQMYNYYVPLRGWDEAIASDIYTYYGGRFGTGQPLMKTAGGRSSLAEDPLAMIGQMAQRSIIAANRNKMKQAFLNFTLNHPSNLASVSEQWYVKNALDEWERRDAVIPADATPDEISKIVAEHEQEMQALAEQGKAVKQRNGLKLDKRVLNGEGAEHTIKVWRGGKEYVIYINGNPAVAQAVNGLTNPDNRGSKLPKLVDIGLAKLKNFLSAVYTSFSPAFVFTNFTRDQLFASQAVYIKYGLKYKRQATKNAMELFATGALPKLVYKWEHGTLDTSNQTEKLFDEFMRGGGETGFTALRDIEAVKKDIENAINGNKENAAKRGWKAFLRSIEFANRSAEDFSRFVTYMTSRQQGKSIVDAIYDAKDITVNFNKKGSGEMGARYMNFAYVFFNAAVQSINNFATMAKQHPARTALVVSKFGSLGFGIPMMNAFLMAVCGGDDERYWDNMEWIRRNNILLYVPFTKDTFISIPLPHELRPFYGMGEIATSILFGKETLEGGFVKALEGFTGMLPIDFTGNGGDLATTLTPTVGQPLAQWKSNTDFFGRKVYNDSENKNTKLKPEWTKAFSTTPPILVDITEALNNWTGGDRSKRGRINLNPDVINHLVKGYFGGTAKFVTQMSSLLYKGFSGNTSDIQWRDIPVGSNFVQQLDERSYGSSASGSYKDFTEEAKETEFLISDYKKQVRMGYMEYAEKITELLNSPEYRRYKIAKAYEKPMDLLRETLKHIDDPTDREAVNSALRGLRRRMMETVEDEKKKNFPKHDDDFSFTGEAIDEIGDALNYSIKGLKQGEQERLEEDYDNDAEEYISENKEETMRIIGELNKLLGKKKAK